MLFAEAAPETLAQVAAIIATALVGAWTTIRVRQIDRAARRSRRAQRAERARCDLLETRVGELETSLGACLKRHRSRRVNPRRKR